MKSLIATAILLIAATATIAQKNYVELRGASPFYNYQEYSRELPNNLTVDLVHVGVTGADEFYIGIGRHFTPAKGVTITPLVYALVGTHGQLGVTPALYVTVEREKWKANAFMDTFCRIKGSNTLSYVTLDTADVTRTVNKRFDAGVSTGFFLYEGQWNVQTGPIVRLKDKHGAWAVSYRFGSGSTKDEVRLTRTISF